MAAIVNGLVTLIWLISTVIIGAASCGIGCLLVVIPILTGTVCVLDILAVGKLDQPPSPSNRSFLTFVAIADIVGGATGMGVVPLVMGILSLVFLNKPEVQRYFG